MDEGSADAIEIHDVPGALLGSTRITEMLVDLVNKLYVYRRTSRTLQ